MAGKQQLIRGRGLAGRWLQAAVVVAVAASMPAAWGAGPAGQLSAPAGSGIQVNGVAAGIAVMSQMGNITTIRTSSQNTIINYQRLTLGSGETLNFIQPNSNSRVLNRIQGVTPTVIDGTVWSNGRVYFVNPAGVMFGNGAVIDVAGLYAAAGHLSDANFIAGINRFTDNTGVVRNDGALRGQAIHLVGGSVANFGQIVTTGGSGVVTMTAGKDVYIGESQSPTGSASVMVKVSSDKSGTKAGTGVQNSGTVEAGGGMISMGAGDMYAAGIYNNGTLRGDAISLHAHSNSNINEGKIDASNANGKGGKIEITGDKVGVLGGTVDASGKTGGGSIKIGGDFHGAGPTQASSITGIASGATIKADALESGDGGEVAIWSDGITRFFGIVSAKGGALGGNGGSVEISGKQSLAFTGSVDLSASAGITGTLLLDPDAITIEHRTSGSSSDDTQLADRQILFADGGATTYTISDLVINSLTAGSTVILQANNSITLNADVNINITNSNAVSLTTTTGDITFLADALSGARLATTTGNVTISAGRDFVMNAGTSDGIFSSIATTTGDVNITAGRNIQLDADTSAIAAARISTSGGDVTMAASGYIWLQGGSGAAASITTGGGSIALQAASSITLDGAGTSVHALLSSTAGGVGGAILISAGDTVLGGGAVSANIILGNNVVLASGGGDITFKATDITFSGGDNKVIAAGTGTVAFETNNNTNTIGLGNAVGASLTITSANLANIASAGTLRFGKNGAQSGAISVKQLAMPLAGTQLEINSNAGAGGVSIDDGASTGIGVQGNLTIRAGTGGITVGQATGGVPEIVLLGSNRTLTLASAGGIGSSSNRLEIGDLNGVTGVTNSGAGVYLTGLGLSGLSFSGVSNAGNPTEIISEGNINSSGVISGTNVVLNAGGGIGTSTALSLDATAASTLTTAGANSAGNIHLTPVSTLAGLTISTAGTPQTVTIDKTGALAVAGDIVLGAGDALVINAGTSGAGNLTFTVPVTLIADSITLHTGTGGGTAAVDLTNLSLVGQSAANPSVIRIEQDATLRIAAIGGANSDLTLISHQGNVIIDANENLSSLVATGGSIVLNGNVTVVNDLTLTGNVILEKNVTLTGSGGATSDLTTTGTIANGSGGSWGLTTSFGGLTLFGGDIGTVGHEVGSLLVQNAGGTVTIGSGSAVAIRTSSNAPNVEFDEDVRLNGNLTITTDSPFLIPFAGVTFGGRVDAGATPSSLVVNLGVGDWTTIQKNVGSLSPLTGLTIHGATKLGNGTAVTVMTTGPINFDGIVGVFANTTVTATGGSSNITFGEQLFSEAGAAWKLTVNSAATVAFLSGIGNGGANTQLGNITVNDTTGTIVLGNSGSFTVNVIGSSSASGADGKVMFNGLTSLNAGTTITADSDVTFNLLLQSATGIGASLTVNTPGGTVFAGGISSAGVNQLSSLQTDAGGTTTFGGGSVITSGAQTYNDKVILGGSTVFQAPSLTFSASPVAIDAQSFDLTLISSQMTFNGGVPNSVIGTGHLILMPRLTSDNILINAGGGVIANTLVIKASDFAIFSGFSSMAIGYAAGTGTFTISAPPVFKVPVGFLMGGAGGKIIVGSAITANGSLNFHAESIVLNADVTTSGKDILVDGTVTLGASPLTINSAGSASGAGNITITGPVAGAGSLLNLFAKGSSTTGDVTLLGPVGTGGPLSGLNISGGNFTVGSPITVNGNINVGVTHIYLHNTGTGIVITTNGGRFNADGLPIDSDGSGTVNLTVSTSAGGVTPASPIALGTVGGGTSHQIQSLNLIATDSVGNADIAVGAVTLNGGNFSSAGNVFTGNGAITTGGGNVTLTHTGLVTFNSDTNAGTGKVSVTGLGVTNIGIITGGSVTLLGGGAGVLLFGGISATGPVVLAGTGVGLASGASITGSSVNADGGTDVVNIFGTVTTGSGGFTSTATGTFQISGTGAVTTSNGVVTINHGGSITINGAISAGTGAVSLTGAGFSNGASITGGAIAINAGSFAVAINAPLIGSGAVSISGQGIAQATGATITGSSASLNGGASTVQLAAAVNAGSGFSSTSVGLFRLLSTGSITTSNGIVSIVHTGSALHPGSVTIGGIINAGSGAVIISGRGLSNSAGATITGGAITLNGGALDVVLNANVTGSGAVTISGNNITQAASTTLTAGSATLNGGMGFVVLSGNINAGSGFVSTGTGVFTLSAGGGLSTSNGIVSIVHSGSVTLNGPVNAGTGFVNVSGAGLSTGVSGLITGGSVTLNGGLLPVSLLAGIQATGAVSITGNGIDISSSIDAASATLNGQTGAVTLSAVVNAGSGFTSTGSGGFTSNVGALITTSNGVVSISHTGSVTLNGGIAAGTGRVAIAGTGFSTGVGAGITGGSITINSGSQSMILRADITGTGPLSFTSGALGITQQSGSLISTSGSAAFAGGTGAVLLSAVNDASGFTSTGSGVFFIDSGGITTTNANVTINHGSSVTLNGPVAAGTGTVSITAGGGAGQSAGIITAGKLILGGMGNFSFLQTNTINSLSANVTGSLAFVNSGALAVSSISASTVTLTAPSFTGGSITATGGSITINGSVNFTGPLAAMSDILINGDATITGNVISTTGSVTFAGSLDLNANITAGGSISIAGPLTLTGSGGTNTLSASGTGGIIVGSTISGAHSLLLISNSNTGKIIVGDIGSIGNRLAGDIEFRSITGGSINGVVLGGDIYARNVTFGAVGGPRSDVPRVATIISRDNLVIDATQHITMEKNQKLTSLGSLSLTAPTLTLGDLGALGTIIIDAKSQSGAIIFVQRSPQQNQGLSHPDQGTDVVSFSLTTLTPNSIAAGFPAAGTTIALRGTVSVVGSLSGQRVEFSSLTATTDIPESANANIAFLNNGDPKLNGKSPELPLLLTLPFVMQDALGVNKAVQNLTPADLANGDALNGTVKDLVATGITGNSPEEGRVIPRDEQMLVPEQANAITGALRDVLREAGINARDLRIEEIINELLHLAVYDDVPYELDPQPKDFRVAVNRLPYAPVLPVVDMTRKLLFKQATDEKGNPVSENGKPKLVSQADAVARAIGEAWLLYKEDKKDDAKPLEFRAYLESKPNEPKMVLALGYLNQLRDLLAAIKGLGLTPKEFDVSKNVLLAKLRFVETVSEEDFPLMVDGPSSLGGNNTAVNLPAVAPAPPEPQPQPLAPLPPEVKP